MTLQKISFEYDIPDGYRFVRIGSPNTGEQYISSNGGINTATADLASYWIIVEKIQEQEERKQENPSRHKHADLIHAWAEGAEIQYRRTLDDPWEDTEEPGFYEENEYRIKTKTKTVRFRNYLDTNNKFCVVTSIDRVPSNAKQWLGDWQEVEIEV